MEFYDYDASLNDYLLSPLVYDIDDPKDPEYLPGLVGMGMSDTSETESLFGDQTFDDQTFDNQTFADQNLLEAEITHVPNISFLDLPEHIQIRIFQYAGLLQQNLIDVSFEGVTFKRGMVKRRRCTPIRKLPGSRATFFSDRILQPHNPIPINVFLVSQAVHDQARRLFFSRNHFSLFLYHKVDLKCFSGSFGSGFEHMKSLYVDMGPRENRSLKVGLGLHRTVMGMWASLCQMVEEHMPNLQDFSFKCCVKDLEAATKLIGAIDPFPRLLQCGIHLGHQRDNDIQAVVKRGVWRLTSNLAERNSFRFLHLPKEVQYLILEELLTMHEDPFIHSSMAKNSTGIITLGVNRQQRSSDTMVTCCGTCSPMTAMCFCHLRQNALSNTCSCFSSPVPYFLVSRGFYEDARRVFFSKNPFAFIDDDADAMMRTLHCIPTASLSLMTRLIFKFPIPRFYYRVSPHFNHDLVSWSILRRFIREHFTLSRLSINIIDPGTLSNGLIVPVDSNHHRFMRQLLDGFRDIKGLREFHVYLGNDRGFEKEAERAVLGRSSGRSHSQPPFLNDLRRRA